MHRRDAGDPNFPLNTDHLPKGHHRRLQCTRHGAWAKGPWWKDEEVPTLGNPALLDPGSQLPGTGTPTTPCVAGTQAATHPAAAASGPPSWAPGCGAGVGTWHHGS